MKKVLYYFLTLFIINYQIIREQNFSDLSIMLLLTIISVLIFNYRFSNNKIVLIFKIITFLIITYTSPQYKLVYAIIIYSLVADNYTYIALPLFLLFIFTLSKHIIVFDLAWIIIGAYTAWYLRYYSIRDLKHKIQADEERRIRYDLEEMKSKLMISQIEIEAMAEIRERNRIARSLHDNLGHNITGVLFQLQAALSLKDKSPNESHEMISDSIKRLSETLEITRETVFNMHSSNSYGVKDLKRLLDSYNYCSVTYSFKGDFELIVTSIFNLLMDMTKELLTNTQKHSKANSIILKVQLNDYYLRYSYIDNGVGFSTISPVKWGLGLKNIKERIENINGSLVMNSDTGFSLICNIPITYKE